MRAAHFIAFACEHAGADIVELSLCAVAVVLERKAPRQGLNEAISA